MALGVVDAFGQTASDAEGIHKIRHVVIIMQENRSFDHYFGTFPGADGIPMQNGTPTACLSAPGSSACFRPYPDHSDRNGGAPHSADAAKQDIDAGKMDGFVAAAAAAVQLKGCGNSTDPNCGEDGGLSPQRVMAYHVESDIPNYWAYARAFVLQDHMFEPVASWSLPSHLYMVSAWSAECSDQDEAESCRATSRGSTLRVSWTRRSLGRILLGCSIGTTSHGLTIWMVGRKNQEKRTVFHPFGTSCRVSLTSTRTSRSGTCSRSTVSLQPSKQELFRPSHGSRP